MFAKCTIKTSFLKNCLLCVVCLSFLALGGCGKKDVQYSRMSGDRQPEGHSMGSDLSGGNLGSGDLAGENYGEGGFESLDSSNANFSANPASEEYKARYGRSTAPLTPVYFDFDSAAIPPTQYQELDASGQYLLENGSLNLVVEGNCDSRGTAEYNLALGELRARSVKKYLVTFGVEQSRIETISFGSERPLYLGSTEEDWSRNRRADLVMP